MNVATITMDPKLAKEKLRAFRASTHRDAEEQYRQCAAGYEALAAGTPLLNLDDVFRAVQLDEHSRPRLAIARSDQKQVRFNWNGGREAAVFNTSEFQRGSVHHASYWRTVNMGRVHGLKIWSNDRTKWWDKTVQAYALVPLVPADVRPPRGQLKNFFTLWEVDHWSEQPIGARPPHDPMLLKHIGGALYAVLAQWDLTALERAVLAGAMATGR